MGWFLGGTAPDEDPSHHVVSVRRADTDRTAGAGVVIGVGTVLTCAHVVNDALGRAPFDPREPGLGTVPVDLHGRLGSRRHYAHVEHWIPPRSANGGKVREGDRTWLGDLAVLRLEGTSSDLPVPPRRAMMSPHQRALAWHGGGDESSFAEVTVTMITGPVGYVDGAPTGKAVGPGYSGGPLWSSDHHAVVGLVAAHFMPERDPASGRFGPYSPQDMIRRSWVIPWQRIEDELLPLGVLDEAAPDPIDLEDPAVGVLAALLAELLPPGNGRVEHGRRLARACGVRYASDVTPPAPEEFASFLFAHPRALPALTAILRSEPGDSADRLLTAAGLVPTALLLTPQEYGELRTRLRLMDDEARGRLGEAVRGALPHLAVYPDGRDLDGLLGQLEEFAGDGRHSEGEQRVPALLRAMEYVAELCAEPLRAELRLWTKAVAARLGISRGALAERREDALVWIRSVRERSARVRVLVEVTRAGPGRHRLGVWCDEGSGLRRVSCESTVSYTSSEAAQEVLRAVTSLTIAAGSAPPPMVEVLVDRDGLDLPVDEWAARMPGELVPGVLGVEFPVVVHCPELLRRHGRFLSHWRTRWSLLDSGEFFTIDASMNPDTVYPELVNRLDTVRVSVDVPPGRSRRRIVQTCLALGIPVVVWDRGSNETSHVVRYMAEVATRQLPEGVRGYRANALARPPDFPGRPVLAWADADRAVPRLQLSEPQEST
ncbi:trypsin-like peptidase domain-containing protein [Streptomyces sp. 4F14]|uniref:VMAP-C domain-containing protein n=1 Tax=Streptomyces sp. 4F14 TaxID=3394380 RepID=UPI003A868C7D